MADAAGGLLDRTAELRILDELVVQSVRRGHAVVIEGEPGIGKTRLLRAALERATRSGLQVYSAAAEELDSRRPFGVIADCLGIRSTAADARRQEIGQHLFSEATLETVEWPAPDPGPEYRLVEQIVALVDAVGPIAGWRYDDAAAWPAGAGHLRRSARKAPGSGAGSVLGATRRISRRQPVVRGRAGKRVG